MPTTKSIDEARRVRPLISSHLFKASKQANKQARVHIKARRHRDVAHFVDAKYACKRSWKAWVGIFFRPTRFPSCPQHAIIPARARHACASKCSAYTYRASIVLTGAIHSSIKHDAFRQRRTRTLDRAHMNGKKDQTIHLTYSERASECETRWACARAHRKD